MAVVPEEAVAEVGGEQSSSGGPSLCQWFLSFDAPKKLVIHGPSAHFAHVGQIAVLVIVVLANFTTKPWKIDSDAQYYFSAASTLPAVESLSIPKVTPVSGDAWRIRARTGLSTAWDVAELEIKIVDEASLDHLPTAISSGSVSDAQHGGFPGYEPDKAFDLSSGSLWGGRKDAEGHFWIGLEYKKSVEIASIRVMQGTVQDTTHVATNIAIEVRIDGVWQHVEDVTLLAKGGTLEDTFKLEDSDDVLAQGLVWPSEIIDPTRAFSPDAVNCSLPGAGCVDGPVWTMDQFFPVTGHSSLFIPFAYVDQLESFRVCRQPSSSFDSHPCSPGSDEECRASTGDPASICSGDGLCLVRRWCALPGRSTHVDLTGSLSEAQYQVIARLKPHGKQDIYSNYKSSAECTNCRFKPSSILAHLQDKPADVNSVGLEMEHTFHWECDDAADDRYGCNVWTQQTVTRHQFSISRSTVPAARAVDGGMLRRSVTFYGMNIHFKGEGHTEAISASPIIMMICQVVALVMVAGIICFSVLFSKGHPNITAFEPYPDSIDAKIWEVVKLKKAANPELQGLTNHRLHQRVKEDVEIMSGVGMDDSDQKAKMRNCLEALKKNNGSAADAARELALDGTVIQSITEEVKVGHPNVKAELDKASKASTSQGAEERSDYSQETV